MHRRLNNVTHSKLDLEGQLGKVKTDLDGLKSNTSRSKKPHHDSANGNVTYAQFSDYRLEGEKKGLEKVLEVKAEVETENKLAGTVLEKAMVAGLNSNKNKASKSKKKKKKVGKMITKAGRRDEKTDFLVYAKILGTVQALLQDDKDEDDEDDEEDADKKKKKAKKVKDEEEDEEEDDDEEDSKEERRKKQSRKVKSQKVGAIFCCSLFLDNFKDFAHPLP